MPRETTPFTRKVCSTSGGAQHQQPVEDKRGGFKERESRIQGFSWKKKSEKGLSLGLGLGLGWGRGGMFIFKLIRRLRFFKAPEREILYYCRVQSSGYQDFYCSPGGGVFLSFFPAFLPRKFLEQAHPFLLALFQGGLCTCTCTYIINSFFSLACTHSSNLDGCGKAGVGLGMGEGWPAAV